MTSKIFHRFAMHRHVILAKTDADVNRRSIRFRRMQIPAIVLMIIVRVAPIVQADPYEVLVVGTAGADDVARIEEFKKMPKSSIRFSTRDIQTPGPILAC
jgi:hypothetical protein